VEELPEYGTVVPKHVGVIKDYSIVDVYVSMCILFVFIQENKFIKMHGVSSVKIVTCHDCVRKPSNLQHLL